MGQPDAVPKFTEAFQRAIELGSEENAQGVSQLPFHAHPVSERFATNLLKTKTRRQKI